MLRINLATIVAVAVVIILLLALLIVALLKLIKSVDKMGRTIGAISDDLVGLEKRASDIRKQSEDNPS